jgi:hypothetical protein
MIIFLFFISFYTKAETCRSFNLMDRVLGSWESYEGDETIKESWHKVSTKTIEGSGGTYVKGNIKASESMRIVEMSDSIFYIAKVSHNPVPVAFKLVKCNGNTFVFENEKHDFPKRIEYKFLDKNRMLVKVSDGKGEGFTIDFNRTHIN